MERKLRSQIRLWCVLIERGALLFFGAQPLDQAGHLFEAGADFRLGFSRFLGWRPFVHRVFVGGHRNAEHFQHAACFVACMISLLQPEV